MRTTGRRGPLCVFLLVVLLAGAALSCGKPPQGARAGIPHGTVELMPENEWIAPGQPFDLALRFQLEEGWHIYWINPGDSGEPPRVNWELPGGIGAGDLQWPAPERMGTSTITDFGYRESATLLVPMQAAPSLAAGNARIGAGLSVVVCREVCIPGEARLEVALPVRAAPPRPVPAAREVFAAARRALPRPAPADWTLRVSEEKDRFVLAAETGQPPAGAVFFPLADSQIENAAPQPFQSTENGFQLTLMKSKRLVTPLDRLEGVVVLSGGGAYRIEAPVGNAITGGTPR